MLKISYHGKHGKKKKPNQRIQQKNQPTHPSGSRNPTALRTGHRMSTRQKPQLCHHTIQRNGRMAPRRRGKTRPRMEHDPRRTHRRTQRIPFHAIRCGTAASSRPAQNQFRRPHIGRKPRPQQASGIGKRGRLLNHPPVDNRSVAIDRRMCYEEIKRMVGLARQAPYVFEEELPENINGVYDEETRIIVIDPRLNERQKRCTLTHELFIGLTVILVAGNNTTARLNHTFVRRRRYCLSIRSTISNPNESMRVSFSQWLWT